MHITSLKCVFKFVHIRYEKTRMIEWGKLMAFRWSLMKSKIENYWNRWCIWKKHVNFRFLATTSPIELQSNVTWPDCALLIFTISYKKGIFSAPFLVAFQTYMIVKNVALVQYMTVELNSIRFCHQKILLFLFFFFE